MAQTVGRLTALGVSRAAKPGMHPDGGGLYLLVSGAGAKSWTYRYQHQGRERQMGLGSLSAVSLLQARQKAGECRSQRAMGIGDPIQARDAVRAATRPSMTFAQCAQAYRMGLKSDYFMKMEHPKFPRWEVPTTSYFSHFWRIACL
jgi:hypothetical protein